MRSRLSDRVADVDHAIVESSVVEQLEVESHAPRHRRLSATHDDRAQQQHALIDQSVPECLRRDPRTPDAQADPDVSLSRRLMSGD